MKFSEYVVLGSTFIKFAPETYLIDGCGCLIGMGVAAKSGDKNYSAQEIMEVFPWLFKQRGKVRCPVCRTEGYTYAFTISCVAVHLGENKITFKEALEYLESIEPQEESSQTAYGCFPPKQVQSSDTEVDRAHVGHE